jgi:hypothetical protein
VGQPNALFAVNRPMLILPGGFGKAYEPEGEGALK